MKKRFLKEKTIFIILTLMFSLFSFPVFSEKVKAQETQQGCCQKTKDNAYCRMTSQDNCETQINPAPSCNEDSKCSESNLVTCQLPNGVCNSNVFPQECTDQQGNILQGSLDTISQCKQGCCILGSNCQITTNSQCNSIATEHPGLTPEFRPDVIDTACTDICEEMEEGCCILEGTYSYVKKVDCKGEFQIGKLCSSLPNSPCEKNKGTGCYNGNIYSEDSCGNKEELKEECNLENNKFCKDNAETNIAICEDTSCKNPYIDKWNIHDTNLGPGKVKQEGESWCIYESPTGNYYDRPGSIHYRHYCLQRQEIVEPCKNFRESVCSQASTTGGDTSFKELQDIAELGIEMISPISPGDFPMVLNSGETSGECIENNIYDSKISTDVSTVPLGFPFWESQSLEGRLSTPLQFILTAVEGQIPGSGTVLDQVIGGDMGTQGTATDALSNNPNLPRTEPNQDTNSVCSKANEQVTVKYLVGEFCPNDCIKNCYAEKDDWITKKAEQCKSLGDCGLDYGVEADQPSGFLSFSVYWTGSAPGPRPTLISPLKVIEWGIKIGVYKGMKGLSSEFNLLLTKLGCTGRGGGKNASLNSRLATGGIGAGIGAIGFVFGPIGFITTIIGTIVGALFGGCEEQTKTVTVTCKPWSPPAGGDNCNKCRVQEKFEKLKNVDGTPFNTCTEYRCRALGTACKFIPDSENSGAAITGICIEDNPTDVSSPKISPNYQEFEKEGISRTDIEESSRGFKINKLLDAYKPFTLPILTDELAICSYTVGTPKNKFEDMDNTITTTYIQDHRILIAHPPSSANEEITTDYYIICQDVQGNPRSTTASYEIEFTTTKEPDLAPPIVDIVKLATPNGVNEVKASETQIDYMALVYDSSLVNCRWSDKEENYDAMLNENRLICQDERNEGIYYPCQGTFTNLQQGENNFYISCKDESDNHWISAPKKFTLTRTEPLQVVFNEQEKPSDPFYNNAFTLSVLTKDESGPRSATCFYSVDNSQFMRFLYTDSSVHSQSQGPLVQKRYDYDIKCTDIAGNEATTALAFTVGKDTEPPKLNNIYKEANTLFITLNELATCKFKDQDFNYETDGTEMSGQGTTIQTTSLTQSHYFIRCKDQYNNDFGPIEVYA
ncbi:MAG: hypothetical protein AABX29_02240 [Nanoarchaeota archaeon]